jgi:MFS family permease
VQTGFDDGARHRVRILLAARAVRAFGDGCAALLVPVYLSVLGFGPAEVGVLTTAMLLGSATLTLGVSFLAHRVPARQILAGGALLMTASGIVFAVQHDFWPLLLVAFFGTLNPSATDVSVFVPSEHSMLAEDAPPERRTNVFATYSLVGALAGAVGSLAAAVPEVIQSVVAMPAKEALQVMFFAYGAVGLVAFALYRRLPQAADAGAGAQPVKAPLGPSRRIVYTLTGLFCLDSFGGGFLVQSLLALWLFDRFGISLGAAASLFFWSGVLSAFSYPAAAWVARRIGLINTMVFTHLPSNLCIVFVPFAPDLGTAVAVLLVRSALSQMDVPTRTSYVMAVVRPEERAAAAAITSAPRSIAGSISPALAGWLLTLSGFGWPLLIGGALKGVYDILLLLMFRLVRPPEELPVRDDVRRGRARCRNVSSHASEARKAAGAGGSGF